MDKIFLNNPLFDSNEIDIRDSNKSEIKTELSLTKISDLGSFKIYSEVLNSRANKIVEILDKDFVTNDEKLDIKSKLQSIEYCLGKLKELQDKLD